MAGKNKKMKSRKKMKAEEKENKDLQNETSKKHAKTLTPLQSTQQNIPITDIVNGVISTRNNQYYKMIEVRPTPFMLKNVRDRNAIWAAFEQVLKVCPDTVHIKSMGLPADLSSQIEDTQKNMAVEDNFDCRVIGAEYVQHLREIERSQMQHKFYIFIPYMPEVRMSPHDMLEDAVSSLENKKQTIGAYLERCTNEIVQYANAHDDTLAVCDMLFHMYNRGEKNNEFQRKYAEVYSKYVNKFGKDNFFLPPADIFAPKMISYLDPKYLNVGGTYYSFLYFTSDGYPKFAYAGWLNQFINSLPGVDVDIFLKRRDKDRKKNAMRRALSHAAIGASSNSTTTEAGEASVKNYQSARYILDQLNNGFDIYDVATVITVTGKDPMEIDRKITSLKSMATASDLKVYQLKYQCEEMFNACLPCGNLTGDLFNKMKRNMTTDGAACLYPFTTFELIHKDGLNIGESNGAPVIPDFFNRTVFDNPNVFICGKSGAGKSASLMQIAIRARIKHMHVYILAPEKQNEFKRLCASIGGQFVTIGPGSADRVNIFDIVVPDSKTRKSNQLLNSTNDEEDDDATNPILARIGWLQSFFSIYLGEDFSHSDEDILNKALINTYLEKGIDVNNPNTVWADLWHTRYKEMPIMSDLILELGKIQGGSRLRTSLNTLAEGAGAYFNGHTNVDINNEFVVFGLEDNHDQFLGPAMFMALEFTWDKIKNDRIQKKMLIIDEWWRMAFDKIAAERTMKIARLSRGLGCSTVISTQQMNDVMAYEDGKYGKAVINNCATKIIMGLEDEELKSVRKIIDLSSAEVSQIKSFPAGSALMIAGTTRMAMRFTPTDTEKMLVFNDDKTLAEYRRRREAEVLKRKKAEAARNAKSVDEIFVSPFDDSDTDDQTDKNDAEPAPSMSDSNNEDSDSDTLDDFSFDDFDSDSDTNSNEDDSGENSESADDLPDLEDIFKDDFDDNDSSGE